MENDVQSPSKIRGVSLAEILGVAAIVLGSVLMFWKNTDVRLSALEIRMNGTEKVIDKIDRVQQDVNEIKLSLKDKQDRK